MVTRSRVLRQRKQNYLQLPFKDVECQRDVEVQLAESSRTLDWTSGRPRTQRYCRRSWQ